MNNQVMVRKYLSIDDIQKELNQFGGFEITKDEQNLLHVSNEYKDSNDFDNDEVFVDLDKEISLKENKEFVPLKLDREVKPKQRERRGLPENIINKINVKSIVLLYSILNNKHSCLFLVYLLVSCLGNR